MDPIVAFLLCGRNVASTQRTTPRWLPSEFVGSELALPVQAGPQPTSLSGSDLPFTIAMALKPLFLS
jgi:hypothetical protein